MSLLPPFRLYWLERTTSEIVSQEHPCRITRDSTGNRKGRRSDPTAFISVGHSKKLLTRTYGILPLSATLNLVLAAQLFHPRETKKPKDAGQTHHTRHKTFTDLKLHPVGQVMEPPQLTAVPSKVTSDLSRCGTETQPFGGTTW